MPGRYVLPLLAVIVASSSSRAFGLPDIQGLPQLTLDRLATVLMAFVFAAALAMNARPRVRPSVTEISLWCLVGWAGCSWVLFGGAQSGYSGAGSTILLNFLLVPAFLYSVLMRTDWTPRSETAFLVGLCIFGIYLGGTALAERAGAHWALIPREIGDPSVGEHWGRSRGPFLQAEFNGSVIVQLMPLLALLLVRARRLAVPALAVATLVLLVIGAYLTYTRAVVLSLLVMTGLGAVWSGPQRRAYRFLAAVLAVGALAVFLGQGRLVERIGDVGTVQARINLAAVTLEMMRQHPLLGIGFGNFDLFQREFFDPEILGSLVVGELWEGGTHNTLMTPAAELGLIAGVAVVALYFGQIVLAHHTLRSSAKLDARQRAAVVAGGLVCAAFIINALLVELRYSLTPNLLFWIGAAYVERGRRQALAAVVAPDPGSERKQASGPARLPWDDVGP